jgi:hypothetical protein
MLGFGISPDLIGSYYKDLQTLVTCGEFLRQIPALRSVRASVEGGNTGSFQGYGATTLKGQ